MKLVTRHPAQLATCVHPTSAISRRTGKNPSRSLTTFGMKTVMRYNYRDLAVRAAS